MLVAAFYHFADLPDYRDIHPRLMAHCRGLAVRGTVLLAPEGVNGTLAGPEQEVRGVLALLREHPRLRAMVHKENPLDAESLPFRRLKIRLKREIVTLGVPGVDARRTGTFVPPAQWNRLIEEPDVMVIDTRNGYEVAAGSFKNAVDPGTAAFSDFPRFVAERLDPARHRKIAMFCTGGIRCEKASAYLLSQGFAEVYQLQGGILKYLQEIPPQDSLWRGECFVFDERVTVTHGLGVGEHSSCAGCGHPVSPAERASPRYREGVHCPRCADVRSPAQIAAAEERLRQARAEMRARSQPAAAAGGEVSTAALESATMAVRASAAER